MLVPLLALAAQYEQADRIGAVASALSDVSVGTVRAHGGELKMHRDHPDVDTAYKKLCGAICQDTSEEREEAGPFTEKVQRQRNSSVGHGRTGFVFGEGSHPRLRPYE